MLEFRRKNILRRRRQEETRSHALQEDQRPGAENDLRSSSGRPRLERSGQDSWSECEDRLHLVKQQPSTAEEERRIKIEEDARYRRFS